MRKVLFAFGLVSLALCGAAFAQTPDRQSLLGRLVEALPARESPLTLSSSVSYVTLRSELLHRHPDREADIDAVFARMATCLQIEGDRLTSTLLIEAADAQLTDAEIAALVDFYEGPDYPRLDAFVHQISSSPDLPSAEERAWAEQVVARPEITKFGRLVIRTGLDSRRSPRVEAVIRQCGDGAIAELGAMGLSQ